MVGWKELGHNKEYVHDWKKQGKGMSGRGGPETNEKNIEFDNKEEPL